MNIPAAAMFQMPDDGWFQLSATGEFPHARSGLTQIIDADAIAAIVQKFAEEAARPNFPGVLVDWDHSSLNVDKPTEAAGWIVDVQQRPDGLWGQIRWSDRGAEAVQGGRYRFMSPVWRQEDCASVGENRVRPMRLFNCALTNDPNIKGMVPLANSARPLANSDDWIPWKNAKKGGGSGSKGGPSNGSGSNGRSSKGTPAKQGAPEDGYTTGPGENPQQGEQPKQGTAPEQGQQPQAQLLPDPAKVATGPTVQERLNPTPKPEAPQPAQEPPGEQEAQQIIQAAADQAQQLGQNPTVAAYKKLNDILESHRTPPPQKVPGKGEIQNPRAVRDQALKEGKSLNEATEAARRADADNKALKEKVAGLRRKFKDEGTTDPKKLDAKIQKALDKEVKDFDKAMSAWQVKDVRITKEQMATDVKISKEQAADQRRAEAMMSKAQREADTARRRAAAEQVAADKQAAREARAQERARAAAEKLAAKAAKEAAKNARS